MEHGAHFLILYYPPHLHELGGRRERGRLVGAELHQQRPIALTRGEVLLAVRSALHEQPAAQQQMKGKVG